MKIAFFSKYLTHHQTPFCRELQKIDGVEFTYVAFLPLREERLALGYEDMNQYPYVLRAYENDEQYKKAEKLCAECDILIFGNAPEQFLLERAKTGKSVFVFSERLFKQGIIHAFSPRVIKKMLRTHSNFKDKPAFLLSASAFAASDFAKFGAYKNKAYKWGYFPEVKRYSDINDILDKKIPASILWVGRMIDWKHPEFAVKVAQKLKSDGYKFTLDMLGTGDMEEKIRADIEKKILGDCVKYHGAVPPERVREYMEKSEIFLFTSDRNEGWGAVLNESMNSGCAVVASNAIGSVPYMVKDGENGLTYTSGNVNDLCKKVKLLLDNPETTEKMALAAYETCVEQWCPENAAKRFYSLSKAVLQGDNIPKPFDDGVCSKA